MKNSMKIYPLAISLVLGLLVAIFPLCDVVHAGAWTGSGPGTVTLSNLTTFPRLEYSLSGDTVFSTQTWDLHAIANANGPINLTYRYEGYHSWYQVRVFLDAYVIHNGVTTVTHLLNLGPVDCCNSPSGGFSESGSVTLNVQDGDTYGFKFGGSNYDNTKLLQGTFTASTWSGSGPVNVALFNLTTPAPRLEYSLTGEAAHSTQTWDLHAIANVGGAINLPYRYEGYHAWYQVIVFLDAYVIHNGVTTTTPLLRLGPVNCCDYPSGGFSESGSVTLSVHAGDTYGFKFGGSNWDAGKTLQGTFSIAYDETVQKVFIGYYQRPAAPAGLFYWANRLYESGGDLHEIIEAFANSAESQRLYGDINSSNIASVVTSIYWALFNRPPTQVGLNYYVNGFNSGQFTPATIMLNILDGAQNQDLQSVNNKVNASKLFTKTLDPDFDGMNIQATYSGDADAQQARSFLSAVTWDPTTVPTQAEVTSFIKTYIADPGDPILNP